MQAASQLPRERLTWMYTQMLRIREFEERVKRTFVEHPGVIRGHAHLGDGAEASIVGALATRAESDPVMPSFAMCHVSIPRPPFGAAAPSTTVSAESRSCTFTSNGMNSYTILASCHSAASAHSSA